MTEAILRVLVCENYCEILIIESAAAELSEALGARLVQQNPLRRGPPAIADIAEQRRKLP